MYFSRFAHRKEEQMFCSISETSMNNLLAIILLILGGIFQIIGAAFQFAFMAFLALVAAPFAFVAMVYHLFFSNKKDN